MDKLDNFWLGFISALFIPVGFVYAFIGLRYHGSLPPWLLLQKLYELKGLTALIAVAALPNLIVFYFFLHYEYWKGGKGILAAVMSYGIIIALIYFYKQ